jgi:cyclopropane-fatty-acyl-phospholipid synthase
MFWEKQFEEFVGKMTRFNVPVRLGLWNGKEVALGPDPRVKLAIRSPVALRYLLKPSMATIGQAYVDGELDVEGKVDDIFDVVVQLSANGRAGPPRRSHYFGRHTRKADAEAISYHYDVSNEFYSLWLDRAMVYSCAYFKTEGDSLDQAQEQKIDHILTKLQTRPGQTLLDIGCGWGALAMRAAGKFGLKAVGITLSKNQYELARARVAEAGLSDRVEIRIQDYREVSGRFDRITSVGMFEHVGLKNLRAYFAKINELLVDGGVCMNHGITSTDADSAQSPFGGGEFIERYVFPQGELPHIGLTLKEMTAAGLEAVDVENLRRHYALTTSHWSRRFEANLDKIRNMVGEKRFRIWRAYLAGCAYGFANNWIALHQVVAVKAGGPGSNPLPLTRDYMYKAG